MELENELICTYFSQRQRLSIQHLFNPKFVIGADGEPTHIQGWCEKVTAPKTLRVDHIVDIHDSLVEANIHFENVAAQLEAEGFEFDRPKPSRLSSPDTMDICFTGFTKSDKEEVVELAKNNGMEIRNSVTKHLDILCYGYNAGPKKLEKALAQGVMILNQNQLEALIETGEVPEDV
jgi:BRCT domain type II-containing protein